MKRGGEDERRRGGGDVIMWRLIEYDLHVTSALILTLL